MNALDEVILSTFRRVAPPDVSPPIGIEEEYCAGAFVGLPWWEVIGRCLDAWDCLLLFEADVFAYYLPAFAAETFKFGYSDEFGFTGSAESFLHLVGASLRIGCAWGDTVLGFTSSEERKALRQWLEWVNSKTTEIRECWPQNKALLDSEFPLQP